MATGIGQTAYESLQTITPSGLQSLAKNSNVITDAINNGSALRYNYIEFELYLASIDLSTQTTLAIYIWLLEAPDGTNYEDGSASVSPARRPDCIIPLRAANAAQRVKGSCLIPPGSFTVLIGNRSGAAFAASENTFKYRRWSDEVNN